MSNLKLPTIKSYNDALRALNDAPKSGRIAHNTTIAETGPHAEHYDEMGVSIVYHQTPIVTYFPNGDVKLCNGGWNTTTTSNRMHQLTPDWITVRIKGGEMLVNDVPMNYAAILSPGIDD